MDYKNFESTALAANYSIAVSEKNSEFCVGSDKVHILFEVTLQAMSDYARTVASKENPIAITIDDYAGNTLLALVMRYVTENAESEDGSWEVAWTFNEDDLKDCIKYPISESKSNQFFTDRAVPYHFGYASLSVIYLTALCMAETLITWLDTNASEETPVGVELEGFFKASVEVVDGKKEMTFTADEEIINIAKNDVTLQSN